MLARPLLCALLGFALGCGADSDDDSPAETTDSSAVLVLTNAAPAVAPAGELLSLGVDVTTAAGAAAELDLVLTVTAGGGSVATARTDAEGHATVAWTLGLVPVDQKLTVEAAGQLLEIVVRAERSTPLTSEPFGDVPGFLAAAGIDGSTEDLVFLGDTVRMGAPGGMLTIDSGGVADWVSLTGDAVQRGWGLAAEPSGTIWMVDADAQTLLRVSPAGEVSTVLTEYEGVAFDGLNDVEVGPDGKVYVSDPCLGRLFRYDPAKKVVDAVHDFDLPTEGGPNGFAFDAEGRMVVSTENTSILCGHTATVAIEASLASLYRIELSEAGFGARTVLAEGLGVFGDGVTFDADGNVYVIIDTLDGLALGESAVWVLPASGGPAQKLVVADGVLYANLAFGRGAFGETTLYLALLQIPVFTGPESRGLQRVELGIAGAIDKN